MKEIFEEIGMTLETFPYGIWYTPLEIPYIVNERNYQIYKKCADNGELLKYFRYNSWVFRSRKPLGTEN
jgi:hypothetical protein